MDHDVEPSVLPHFFLPFFKLGLLLIVSTFVLGRPSVLLTIVCASSGTIMAILLARLKMSIITADPDSLDVIKAKLKEVICESTATFCLI